MDMFKVCLEEISLSGLEGCTLEELWAHLSNRHPPISFKLDSFTINYLWKQILGSITSTVATSPILLYQLPQPRVTPQVLISPVSAQAPLEYKHPLPFKYVSVSSPSTNQVVRGSCDSYHVRKDVTMAIGSEGLSLTDVMDQFGTSLVLVTNQELRECVLVPSDMDPCIELSEMQYGMLEVVGCARHNGIPRPFVTSKYMKIDPRSTYFYVKQLETKGLIFVKSQRRTVSATRTQVLSLLYLSRYDGLPENLPSKEEEFCSLLTNSPYNCKPIKTMWTELGVKAKETKRSLIENGFVENVLMKQVAEEYANDPTIANVKACRLLKPYVVAKETVEGECGEEEDDADSCVKVPLVTELPLEAQGYRFIDSCGSKGITQEDFNGRRGLDLTRFTNRGIVKNLIRKSKVFAIIQDAAPVRTVSLVTAGHVSKNKHFEELQEEAVKSGMQEGDLPILTGNRYFPSDVRHKRERKVTHVKVEEIESAPVIDSLNEVPPMIAVTDSLLADMDVSTPDSSRNEELDNSRDSVDSKIPMSDISIPTSPFQRSVSPSGSIQGLESGTKKRSHFIMTYKQLKRTRFVLEYFEKHRVVTNLFPLCKCIREVEHKEGQEQVLDSKTLRKLIIRLVTDNKLCSSDVTLSIDPDNTSEAPPIPVGSESQTTTLYYIPTATKEERAVAQEAAYSAFKALVHRRALKKQPKKEKKTKKKKTIRNEFGLDSDSEDGESPNEDMVDVPNVTVSSKFQRLRHFHCYLWILAHGHITHTSQEEGDSTLSKAIFPWASGVSKLPPSSKGEGWLNYFDISHNIPLSLFLFMSRIINGNIPSRFLCYFEDPSLMNTSFYQLPMEIKRGLLRGERERSHVTQTLQTLEEMSLITIDGQFRDRSNVFINLTADVTILDTSSCSPRRSFFLNSARPLFKEISLSLQCLSDVEKYWFQLQTICQQTSVILVVERKKRKRPSAANDIHPLHYTASDFSKDTKPRHSKFVKDFNKQGFGAGGLPPMLFAHSSRNWVTHYNTTALSRGEDIPPSVSRPGVPLNSLPYMDMGYEEEGALLEGKVPPKECFGPLSGTFGSIRVPGDGGVGVSGGGVEEPPLSKKPKLSKGVRVSVAGGQIVKNDGGRGRERIRMKKVHKAVKTARKVKTKQVSQRFKFFHELSLFIEDDTQTGRRGEERVKESSERVNDGYERTSWSTEEGNFLLSCYLACVLLHHKGQPRVTFTQLRDTLTTAFPKTRYKATTAVKRYLSVMMRKNPRIKSTLEIRLTECLQEMDAMGEDAPGPTFKELLEFVIKRSEGGKNMFSQEIFLPQTLQELYDNHVIVGGPKAKLRGLPVVRGEHDVNQALISDLIIATVGAEEASYDQYKAFKLFETFPEVDVKVALDHLKREQLIKRKRQRKGGVPFKPSPLETQSYAIAASFYSKLEGQLPPNIFKDMANFQSLLDEHRGQSPCDSTHLTQQPGLCWLEEEQCVRVNGNRAKATSAAALLEASCVGRSMESVTAVLPDPLFEETPNPDLPEYEGEDEISSTATTQLLDDDLEGGDMSDGDDKEEEEVRDEAYLSKEMILKKLKYATGGVSALFGVGAGGMRQGVVEVDPSLSIGKLLEPAHSEQNGRPQESEEKMVGIMPAELTERPLEMTSHQMTIDTYLIICREKLKFADSDILFARELYGIINQSGSNGVQRSNMYNHMALSHLQHTLSLEEHVQTLLNFEMVRLCGVCEPMVVSTPYTGRWHMAVGAHPPYRPWSAIEYPHLNTTLLDKYQHGVLLHIMTHPGVTKDDLVEHFSLALQHNGLRDILQVLEVSNQIKCYRIPQPKRRALFGNREGNDSGNYMEYYEAIV